MELCCGKVFGSKINKFKVIRYESRNNKLAYLKGLQRALYEYSVYPKPKKKKKRNKGIRLRQLTTNACYFIYSLLELFDETVFFFFFLCLKS